MRATLLALAVLCAAPAAARAEGGPFGVGVILGSPTGGSLKLYFDKKSAIDAGIGGSFINQNGLHIHADYLWHPIILTQEEAFVMPLYIGVGGRILLHDRGNAGNDTHIGVRIPAGVLFDFKTIPIDVFIEVALIIDVLQDHAGGDTQILDLNAGIGARYYF